MARGRGTRVFFLLTVLALASGLVPPAALSSPKASGEAYDSHHVLVAFAPGTASDQRAAVHGALGARVENVLPWLNLDVVRLPDGLDPSGAARLYSMNPNVAYAHPNWIVRLLGPPNDPFFREEWGLDNTGQVRLVTNTSSTFVSPRAGTPDADIDAPEGWEAAFGLGSFPSSGGVRVGVVDTGIDLSHEDLLGRTKACATATSGTGAITEGTCADDHVHGTHVAGTIAAATNNAAGIAGVAPNAELAVFKALNADGSGTFADVIAGIHWLHTTGQARIINMSIGAPQTASALDRELSEAAQAGTLLIAAAGNRGDSTLNYPAAHADVVSVAATTDKDAHALFSNCNADVEVAAPGVDVLSTVLNDHYAVLSGTSMATPHASGAAAMIMWKQGTDAAQTRSRLVSTVDDLGPAGRDDCFGHGRVNLARALGVLVPQPPPQPPPPPPTTGSIVGTVKDQFKHVIPGATVDCGSGGKATTGYSGTYTIDNVPPGTYTCTASKPYFKPRSQRVTVEIGRTTTANFTLRPE